MHVIRQCVVRFRRENVKRKPRNKSESRVENVNVPTIGQMNSQLGERFAIQFLRQSPWIHFLNFR